MFHTGDKEPMSDNKAVTTQASVCGPDAASPNVTTTQGTSYLLVLTARFLSFPLVVTSCPTVFRNINNYIVVLLLKLAL